MICKKQEIITKKYTYMDLQKISKNNHHLAVHVSTRKNINIVEHIVVCQICDDLGWINHNYQMECFYGIIGANNSNNKKFKSFAKS